MITRRFDTVRRVTDLAHLSRFRVNARIIWFHKAFVDVNEEGAEAAAATALTLNDTGAPPSVVTFRADHPFLFTIRDTRSGAILFLGRVADPTTES